MDGSPTVRRWQLAAELRRLRLDAGLSVKEVAEKLGWQQSKLSRIENREIKCNAKDVTRLIDQYAVTDKGLRRALVEMARRASEQGWWQSLPSSVIPSEYKTLIGLEAEAISLRSFQLGVVPGMLQTADYARVVLRIRRPGDTAEQIDRRVEVRLERQEVLTRDEPPEVVAVIAEGVLRQEVGSPEIMRRQLLHLAAEHDGANITIQVLPFSAGAHPAMDGGFDILTLPAPGALRVVSTENIAGSLLLEKVEEIQRYEEVWGRLRAQALSPDDSRAILRSLAVL